MKNILNKILTIFFCTLITSCNKKEEIVVSDKNVKIDSFQYNLKNKEKIFLDFWSGINHDDFFKVYELQKSKRTMSDEPFLMTYKLGENEVQLSKGNKLKFIYGNDVFYRNSKNENIECIYLHLEDPDLVKLFFKKYNITDYKEINKYNYFIEENPLYDFNDSEIKEEIEIKRVKRERLDIEDLKNIQYNKNCDYTKIIDGGCMRYKDEDPSLIQRFFFDYTKKIQLTINNLVIDKENKKLLFFNAISEYKTEHPNTMGAFGTGQYLWAEVFYPYGTKESALRIIKEYNNTDVFVTYTTKKYYEKIILKEKSEENKKTIEKRNVEKRIENRKRESLDEI